MRKTTDLERKAMEFLNDLRASGDTNMFGSPAYVIDRFDVTRDEATKLVSLWMSNFNEERNYDTVKS